MAEDTDTLPYDEALATLEKMVGEQQDEIDAWKSASGLIGSGGDPSTVMPTDLENYVTILTGIAEQASNVCAYNLDSVKPNQLREALFVLRYLVEGYEKYEDEEGTSLSSSEIQSLPWSGSAPPINKG